MLCLAIGVKQTDLGIVRTAVNKSKPVIKNNVRIKLCKFWPHRLRWLDHRPFKAEKRDRHPLGLPKLGRDASR